MNTMTVVQGFGSSFVLSMPKKKTKEGEYILTQKDYDELLGLRCAIADVNYLREKYKNDVPVEIQLEMKKSHEGILWRFERLDELGIPFWIQNIVCSKAEDWRHCLGTYLYEDLEVRGVDCSHVSCR